MNSPVIEPLRLQIPQAQLDDLHARLDNARLPAEAPDTGWSRGIPPEVLTSLVRHWRDGDDWRAAEARLNSYDNFRTVIDGTPLHFLHIRSPHDNAIPLVLIHGWPGSIVEFLDLIEPLTNPEDPADAFHVVIPSLPGFGFSGPTPDTGWTIGRIAAAIATLMARLGYERYGAQGGDWGSGIAMSLSRNDSEHVLGSHVNMLNLRGSVDETPGGAEHPAFVKARQYRDELGGYAKIQSTRPQTLAYALADSPIGQLAWIAEKFHDWTDIREQEDFGVDVDRLLTNVMIYWLTNTAGSSAQIYYETAHEGGWPEPAPGAPVGVAVFPADLAAPVREVAEQQLTVTRWSELDRGGHFAALEVPDLLLAEIRAFFAALR